MCGPGYDIWIIPSSIPQPLVVDISNNFPRVGSAQQEKEPHAVPHTETLVSGLHLVL